jgi:tetratricopeptide (TPR) repeat protein
MRKLYLLLIILATGTSAFAQTENRAHDLFKKGYAAIDDGDYDAAINHLLKAIEIDSTGDCGTGKKGKAHSEVAFAYSMLSNTEKALEYAERSSKINGKNPTPHHTRAVVYLQQGKIDEAINALTKVIEVDSESVETYVERGLLYNLQKKKELALKDLEYAMELNKERRVLPRVTVREVKGVIKELKKS